MDLGKYKNIYFIGIGGIGMSALARYFVRIGKNVSGYDKTESTLTHELQSEGIEIDFNDISNLENYNKADTLVVITPAVPDSHKGLKYFGQNNFDIHKRSEVLGEITRDSYCFAVAGTHGKTTTSAILGHILLESGEDVTAFVGGIVENYNSNIIGSGKRVSVVEADEFDRSFLRLYPDMVCIASMDADHLDIYGDDASIKRSFKAFADKISDNKFRFVPVGLPLDGTTVGIETEADFIAKNIRIVNGKYVFDIKTPREKIADVKFSLPGRHNLMNALMAFAMAETFGTPTAAIAKALATFKGIRRRFAYQIDTLERVFIDDYAHHPTEIDAVHDALRELYPNDKITAVFQPHLFSRTRDFAEGFARSLSRFDEVLLMEIYPAREFPIEGIDSNMLLQKMDLHNKKLVSKNDLVNVIKKSENRILVTIGAGDLGEMITTIKNALL